MKQSTEQDRAYFARIGRANAAQGDAHPPASLKVSFERYAVLEQLHHEMGGQLLNEQSADGDLASHLAYLARLRTRRANPQVPLLAIADGDNGT